MHLLKFKDIVDLFFEASGMLVNGRKYTTLVMNLSQDNIDFEEVYIEASSMSINGIKSTMSMMNLLQDNLDRLLSLFDFEEVDVQHGVIYLGFVLKPNDYS